MKQPIYAVRDRHVGFMRPTIDINDQTATRNFKYAVNNPGSDVGFNPQDYSLYRIGEYESDTGMITPLDVPQLVCEAVSLLEVKTDGV